MLLCGTVFAYLWQIFNVVPDHRKLLELRQEPNLFRDANKLIVVQTKFRKLLQEAKFCRNAS
jgi:hypothetical protein